MHSKVAPGQILTILELSRTLRLFILFQRQPSGSGYPIGVVRMGCRMKMFFFSEENKTLKVSKTDQPHVELVEEGRAFDCMARTCPSENEKDEHVMKA